MRKTYFIQRRLNLNKKVMQKEQTQFSPFGSSSQVKNQFNNNLKKVLYLFIFFIFSHSLNAITAYNNSSTCSVQVWCIENCSTPYINNIGLIPPGGSIYWITPFCSSTIKLVPEGESAYSSTVYDQVTCYGTIGEYTSGPCTAYTLTASPDCSPCANSGGDSDGDGICNNADCSPNNASLPTTPGTTCNDGNANTINDIIQANGCDCAGTFDACATAGGDSDNDGVCNNDDCEPNNPNLPTTPGTTCNDGNANTINDIIQANGCDCAGTFDACATAGGDSDNDGVCNNDDCEPNNPNLPTTPGTTCNDGNANTINDIIQANGCDCAGTFDACVADGGDSDNDGICDNQDCQPNNPNIPTIPGTACNDGNANTNNDVIQADGCTCEGTPNVVTPDCNDISVSSSNGNIVVSGLDGAPITSVQVFTSAWAGVYNCFANCNSPVENIAVQSGEYLVFVKYYNADYSLVCQEEVTITVGGGGGCTDADNDGVCANEDCDDNNASVPAAVGSSCNDGNADTTNDVIQADGCTCAGTPNGGGGTPDCNDINVSSSNGNIIVSGLDGAPITSVQVFTSAWTEVYNCFANCNTPTETIAAEAGTYLVFVKYYNPDYSLVCQEEVTIIVGGGGCTDIDNDGVCANEDCDDNNASVPAAVGSSCNDGNSSTSNDVIQADGCTCAGDVIQACDQLTDGGEITYNGNVECGGFNPSPISSVSLPSGGSGAIEYLWLSSTSSCPTSILQAIAGSNNATYDPEFISQTTYYVRCSRRAGCTSWTAGESNCVTIEVEAQQAEGTTCNDGNANTNNDVIQADGCTCAGTPSGGGGTPDCNDINVSSSNGNIVVSGLDGAPITSVQVFTSAWAGVYNCFADCNAPTETIAVQSGEYLVFVKYYNADYSLVCQEEVTITVGGGGGCTDADNDGVCANEDCDDNNANVPAAVGSSCNDGNDNTINDVIQADGCTCAGTPNGGGGSGVDLMLTVEGDGNNTGIYQTFTATFTVSNTSDVTSNNVIVNIPQPNGVVFQGGNPFSTSTGDYNYYSTFNWSVGTLTPWQTETITLNYYTIADGPYTVYGQIVNATGNDTDSTPNNGTAPNPNEDDEAVYNTNNGGGGCTDLDNDGVCAADDCNDNDASLPAAPGTSCNDGNANTNNDVIQADGCTCAGIPTNGGTDCDDVAITSNNGNITLSGLNNAPLTAAWVFDASWNTVFNCSYGCATSETVSVSSGTYYVVIKKLNLDWSEICVVEENIVVNGGVQTGILTLTGPNNQTVNAPSGANSMIVTYPTPIANTTCTANGLNLERTQGPASGSAFPIGTATITYQATDACGNNETVSFTITVLPTAPVLTMNCPSNITVDAALGTNSAIVTYGNPTGATTCNTNGFNTTLIQGLTSGSSFPLGTSNLIYQGTDACGESATCNFTITVNEAVCNAQDIVSWDLAACQAFFGANSFSEFTAVSNSSFVQDASNVYRNNPSTNQHSCTPTDITDGVGMCVSYEAGCSFDNNDDRAVRFSVTVGGTNSAPVKLDALEFFEKSNPTAQFINASSVANNYPTKYGVRVTVNGDEVLKQTNISTSQDWSLESIDLGSDSDFTVTSTTTFDFELLAYCPSENTGTYAVWDLDDIKLIGCQSYDFDNDGIEYISENNDEEEEIEAELRNESIEDNSKEISFKVYPNPASEHTNITIENVEEDANLTILVTDQFGRRMNQVELQSFENENYILNTSNYSSGLYFVQIRNSDAIIATKQLVIMKR